MEQEFENYKEMQGHLWWQLDVLEFFKNLFLSVILVP